MDVATLGSKQPPPPPPPHSSSFAGFPVLVIIILGMLTTVVLFVSYHLFVIQCSPSWRHSDLRLSRYLFPSDESRRRLHIPPILHTLGPDFHSLDPSVIRFIPVIKFTTDVTLFRDCAICLNEFQDGERLKQFPVCSHAFHIDCIDTWLEFNSNCPLCRFNVRNNSPNGPKTDHIVVLAPRCQQGDEEAAAVAASNPSPRRKGKKRHVGGSMGDECIDGMGKCEQPWVQPMRRSFSMDSCNGRNIHLSSQEMLRQMQGNGEGSTSNGVRRGDGGGGSGRVRRSLFSFGRSSRSSVIPIEEVDVGV